MKTFSRSHSFLQNISFKCMRIAYLSACLLKFGRIVGIENKVYRSTINIFMIFVTFSWKYIAPIKRYLIWYFDHLSHIFQRVGREFGIYSL